MQIITQRLLITIVLLLLFPLQSVYAANRAIQRIKVRDNTGREQQINLYGESHALLIGVSGYNNGWPRLDAVPGELDKVETLLKAKGFSVTRVDDPDAGRLKSAFEDFVNQYGYDPENRLLFFYSGHGHTRKNGSRGYLVPVDAPNPKINSGKNERLFLQKALPMITVLGWARRIEAKHVMFLFDSCFSGTIFKEKALPDPPAHISRYAAKPVRQFITAGAADEPVPARSTFTPAFIDALEYGLGDVNRDGYVSGTELGQFLQAEVPRHTRQHPQYGKISDYELSRGDFIFLTGGLPEDQHLPPRPAANADTMQSGWLRIVSKPAGATVYVNNKKQDQTTPTLLSDIRAGAWTVRVEKSGYVSAEKKTTVRRGRQAAVSFTLEEAVVTARLTVRPFPDTARVRIVNIRPRYRPGMELAPGKYHLKVTAAGYEDKEQWLDLQAGVDLDVDVRLTRIPEPAPEKTVIRPEKTRPQAAMQSGVKEIKREGRFIAYSNGTVKDSRTGLIWAAKDSSPGDVTWQQAKQYCENYTGGGYSDWRMPTQDELSALYRAGIRRGRTKGNHIIDIYSWVWAAETRGSEAAFVFFSGGNRFWSPQSYSSFYRVLPVRGGR